MNPNLVTAALVGSLVVTSAIADGIVFTDVTEKSGISYVQHSLGLFFYYPVQMSGGVAVGDFDSDGYVDLFVTRLDDTDILYRNMCNGTFSDVTVEAGLGGLVQDSNGAGWGDIDHDGDLDLYVTGLWENRFYLFINDGLGHFTEEAVARGAAVEGEDNHFGYSPTFGDYDRDGFIDIHTTEWRHDEVNPSGAPSNARLLHNRGAESPEFVGFFEDVTDAAGVNLDKIEGNTVNPQDGAFSFASHFSDLDGDGWLDLAVAGDFGQSRLFWNNRDGTFTDGTVAAGVGTDENGMGTAIGDINGDGLLDWFVNAISGGQFPNQTGNRMYLNNGDRTFTDVTDAAGVREGFWGWGASFLDFDHDTDLDLMMVNGVQFPDDTDGVGFDDDISRFWENDGAGVFTEISAQLGITDERSGKGMATFDYDNDGDLDVFVVNSKDQPILYRNDGGNQQDWLMVKPVGSGIGIGARMFLTLADGGPTLVRELRAGNNFLGQNEMTVHFGLGANAGPVAKLLIQWANGDVQEMTDIRPNQTLVLARGHIPDSVGQVAPGLGDGSCTFAPSPMRPRD